MGLSLQITTSHITQYHSYQPVLFLITFFGSVFPMPTIRFLDQGKAHCDPQSRFYKPGLLCVYMCTCVCVLAYYTSLCDTQTFNKVLFLGAASPARAGVELAVGMALGLGFHPYCCAHQLWWHFEADFNLAPFFCWRQYYIEDSTYDAGRTLKNLSP